MDPTKNAASEFERRSSMRHSRRISVQGGGEDLEVEGDDVNYEAMAMADGFRPPISDSATGQTHLPSPDSRCATLTTEITPDTASSTGSPENTDVAGTQIRQPRISSGQRPSSIAKPPPASLEVPSSQHTGEVPQLVDAPGMSRVSSASSDSQPFVRSEGPYQGPSGPSHPYGVYTQNAGLTRTLSVATSSTAPMAESAFTSAPGPTHPYGMYNQGTIDEITSDPVAIPVGFAGRANQYQHSLGSHGEEIADIVGPDGHTEQLPPYSREPPSSSTYGGEAAVRKARDTAQLATSSTVSPTTRPLAGAAVVSHDAGASGSTTVVPDSPPTISGAGGLGLATRNPEFESTDEPGSPRSRHSSRSFATDASQHNINTAAAGVAMSEKGKPLTRWQAWGRRKCCGVFPYWALTLAITVVLLVAALVIGGVVGTRMQNSRKPPPPSRNGGDFVTTATVTYDATAVPTPTDLPPLVTGAFSLPLMASRVANTCFNDTTLAQAWNCNVALVTQVLMTIENDMHHTPDVDDKGYTISITCNESLSIANHVYAWGSQPALVTKPLRMELVNDTFQPGRGPAWFKMIPFNKTIIIPEPVLTVSSTTKRSISARLAREMRAYDYKRKGIAQAGDKAWICTWPETFLEIFIYPMQNSSWAKPYGSGPSGSWPSPSPTPSSILVTSPASIPTPISGTGPEGNLDSRDEGHQDYSGPYVSSHGFDPTESITATITPVTNSLPTATPTPTEGSFPSSGPSRGNGTWEMPPPLYPRVVKIEERRIDHSPMPSCRLVEIQADGQSPHPVTGEDGEETVIWIAENEPSPIGGGAPRNAVRDIYSGDPPTPHHRGETSDMSDCGCIWFTT